MLFANRVDIGQGFAARVGHRLVRHWFTDHLADSSRHEGL